MLFRAVDVKVVINDTILANAQIAIRKLIIVLVLLGDRLHFLGDLLWTTESGWHLSLLALLNILVKVCKWRVLIIDIKCACCTMILLNVLADIDDFLEDGERVLQQLK